MAAPVTVIPLYGFLAGDTLGLLILARPDESMRELAEHVQRSAAVRVAPRTSLAVVFGGRRLPSGMTVARAGITALDRIDVVPIEEERA